MSALAGEILTSLSPGPDGLADARFGHLDHCAVDGGHDTAGDTPLLGIRHAKRHIRQLIGGLGGFGNRCVPGRFGIQQTLQDFSADLFPSETQRLHRLFRRLEMGLRAVQIGLCADGGLNGHFELTLGDQSLFGQLLVAVDVQFGGGDSDPGRFHLLIGFTDIIFRFYHSRLS